MSSRDPAAVRVGIIDPQPIYRLGLQHLLEGRTGWEVVHSADTLDVRAIQLGTQCSLFLLGLDFSGGAGLAEVERCTGQMPSVPVLVVSDLDEKLFAERVVRAGARGFVSKRTTSTDLYSAIDVVLSGDVFLSRHVMSGLARRVAGGGVVDDPMGALTTRELEVFQLMADGRRVSEMADLLHLSPKTIETHQAKLRRKLGAAGTHELYRLAITWQCTGALAPPSGSSTLS